MPNYLSPKESASYLPGRPHYNTVRRWMTEGVSGVRLRSVRFGGKRFTTDQWCAEFIAAVSAATDKPAEHLMAQAQLDAMGV